MQRSETNCYLTRQSIGVPPAVEQGTPGQLRSVVKSIQVVRSRSKDSNF